MYSYFVAIFLLVIFLIFSIAHPQPKRECNELLTNSASDQNHTKCLATHLKDSGSRGVGIGPQPRNENIKYDTSLTQMQFLGPDKVLTFLNIPVTSNGNSVDILKEATSSSTGEEEHTKDNKENEFKHNELLSTTMNTANVLSTTEASTFSIFSGNNEKAIDILKAATGDSIVDNEAPIEREHILINRSHNLEESIMKYDRNFNTSVNKTNNLNEIKKTSTKTNSSANDQTAVSNEIISSELINLSNDDGEELNLGQKIEFQRSNMNSETEAEDTNAIGKVILKNASEICGSYLGRRISFANETTLMEFPWTALLLYNTKIRYHCGGSLITEKYVLTAAHCVAQEFYELLGVRLGEHDITTEVDCAPDLAGDKICATTVNADVLKIIVHHAYSRRSFKNDIALLKLDKRYLSRSYYPICLPKPDMLNTDRTGIVAGWGATEKAVRSTVLLKADVPILDISKCREVYRYTAFNDSTEICGSGVTEVDVCKGDSGGALFNYRNIRGRDKYFQYGIISLGVRQCGDRRFLPAVFTKLNGFYKWIENNLED